MMKNTCTVSPMTTKAFAEALISHVPTKENITDAMHYGYHTGWLEELDLLNKDTLLTRKSAARIIHNFLRIELKEKDEADTRPAQKLQDLYDCRSCVGHVTQVYVKGILDGFLSPDNRFIFGMSETLSIAEGKLMIERCFIPPLRQPPSATDNSLQVPERISYETAMSYLEQNRRILLIDVRSDAEYEESHLKNALHIPLISILKNPYQVCDARDKHILLYCHEGYQSDMAVARLLESGYTNVQSFAIKKD